MKILIKFFVVLSLACASAQGVWGENVTFQERSWNATSKQVVTIQVTKECTVLEGNHAGDWIALGSTDGNNDHYYVVKGEVAYQTLNCFGRVHLILSDGATLTCTGGIKVEKTNNSAHLFIYSQSNGKHQGQLTVTNSYSDAAGIGCGQAGTCGNITIHGGVLDVTGGKGGAGIGAGGYETKTEFTGQLPFPFTFIDYYATDGTTTIYGGKITAYGGKNAAGIGEGQRAKSGSFHLYGGEVTATGGDYGAGIGGGAGARFASEVYIYGGTLNAYGGTDGAGIGGGEKCSGGIVRISGGTVWAEGKSCGSGIGGGEDGGGANTSITGGEVTAIAGGDCQGREADKGSAIGCGDDVSEKDDTGHAGTLGIADGMMVTGGDSENAIERVFTSGERVPACRWRNFVRIEGCLHITPAVGNDHSEPFTYNIISEEKHRLVCRYCNYTSEESHSFPDYHDCVCGQKFDDSNENWKVTIFTTTDGITYAPGQTSLVVKGSDYVLPVAPYINGLTFMGYVTKADTYKGIEMQDSEFLNLVDAGQSVTPTANATYYARYRYDYDTEWIWAADGSNAMVSITNPIIESDKARHIIAEITLLSITEPTDNADGELVYYATATHTNLYGTTYSFTDRFTLTIPATKPETPDNGLPTITLSNTSDNTDALWNVLGETTNVRLADRTLYKDGSWNTLCLPFDLVLKDSPLEGATVKTLTSSDYDEASGTLTLTFTEAVNTLKGGMPYIVKWETEGEDVITPFFNSVTINGIMGGPVGSMYVDFIGTFSPVAMTGNDRSVLYLGSDNKLYYPTSNITLGSCRAYFKLHNYLVAGELPKTDDGNGVRAFVLDFGDGETTGAITSLHYRELQEDGAWYSPDGRRLSGKPTTKGIYINNGKKVVVK